MLNFKGELALFASSISDKISLVSISAINTFVSSCIPQFSEEIGKDFQSSWWVIVTALIVCMCVSLLWILLMRWITPIMVWVSLFGSLAAIIYG